VNNFQLITITHRTANINHIGKYIPVFNNDAAQLAQVLRQIKTDLRIEELFYLATCNRLTFLLVRDKPISERFLARLFGYLHPDISEDSFAELKDVVAIYSGEACLRHVFEIAASLDSLVVGEREILRQLRTAYEFCANEQLAGDNIRILIMRAAITTAKEVYTDTQIGVNSVSVVSLAIQRLLQYHPPKDARFLIVGAGQTNQLVAKLLQYNEFSNFKVFNRSLENAQQLAYRLHCEAYTLNDLANYKDGFDVLITCTGASEAVISPEIYKQLIGKDKQTKIIIDLAVPSDIDKAIVRDFKVRYIEVERLRALAAENLALRQHEVVKANAIIDKRLEECKQALRRRQLERTLSDIPDQVKEIKKRAVTKVFHKEIACLDDQAQATLARILEYVEEKYIGIPMNAVRKLSNEMVV
jgi:glutamyl-tRNA reductase